MSGLLGSWCTQQGIRGCYSFWRVCTPACLPCPAPPAPLGSMKVIPPGLDFSSLKVSMPEDPTLREFEQARAVQDLLEKPQPLSPRATATSGATSPRRLEAGQEVEPAAGGAGAGGTAPHTPSIASGGAAGQQSPRGDSSSGAADPPTPRPAADMALDPHAGPPIWRVSWQWGLTDHPLRMLLPLWVWACSPSGLPAPPADLHACRRSPATCATR